MRRLRVGILFRNRVACNKSRGNGTASLPPVIEGHCEGKQCSGRMFFRTVIIASQLFIFLNIFIALNKCIKIACTIVSWWYFLPLFEIKSTTLPR
jgi:hypothetical protein